jgi:hypothetical protein
MRNFFAAGLALSALLGALTGNAHAVEYPWCSIEAGSRQCNFASRAECAASSSRGFGSLCSQNPSYRGPPEGAVGEAVRVRSDRSRHTSPKHIAAH